VYLDHASSHPLSVHTAAALHRYADWLLHDLGEPWWPTWAGPRDRARQLFAELINASPDEVAYARSTVESESNLLNGMAAFLGDGNVVTHDLHYAPSLYNYEVRRRNGLEVRVVRHRDWRYDLDELARHIDRHTRLVAVSLVSNVNGAVADIRAISELAHDHGALLYADIIQAAGAVPIDVKTMGIDLAACSTFKWLMGVKGFGFLYVRADLQGHIIRPSQPSGGVQFNYEPWAAVVDPRRPAIAWTPTTGPAQYEVSYPSYEGLISSQESLAYILGLGVARIRAHVRSLTDRLQQELPALGYASITPPEQDSPICAFTSPDPAATLARARQAGIHVAMRFGNKLRLSPSVYNDHGDIDRLLAALR
jgi:selenocysteine lyase/cysteine desulfurase